LGSLFTFLDHEGHKTEYPNTPSVTSTPHQLSTIYPNPTQPKTQIYGAHKNKTQKQEKERERERQRERKREKRMPEVRVWNAEARLSELTRERSRSSGAQKSE